MCVCCCAPPSLQRAACGFAPASGTSTHALLVGQSSDFGSRLFFGLNLALSPSEGHAFTDGVDLQKKALDFAMTLPKTEREEWLRFLDEQFRINWLSAGGKYYHSKLRTGRPDSDEAQLSEFLPLENPYFANVQARLKRADPVAEFRVAFPTMFSTESVALAGTSASRTLQHVKPPSDKGKDKDKDKDKGKGKKRDKEDNEPGSKAKLAMPISASELWLGGVVFDIKKIAEHYKITDPKCWPVLLTKKKGNDALSICPDHGAHGDLKQAIHQRPGNLQLNYIYKHFTRAATSDENKKAKWDPPSKRSKN